MKYAIAAIALTIILVSSCNENQWLKEEPKDFYAPDNSYQTVTQFKQSLNFLYDNLRLLYWYLGDESAALSLGDIAFGGTDYPDGKFNNFKAYITPTTYMAERFWNVSYNSIANANIIIDRLEANPGIAPADRNSIKGEALFFRAFWYRFLAHLYGGAPLVLEESTAPRRDYQRAAREEVYRQARADLEEAVSILQDITEVKDGQISKQAAQHLLAEVYISLGLWQDAVGAASAVINHPSMTLMTERFGSRAAEEGSPYWDLFQLGNQNRAGGNRESLLVLQFEYQNSGASYGSFFPRYLLPFYPNVKVDGKDGSTVAAFTDITSQKGGRGIGVIQPTEYFLGELWGDDFERDLRNSQQMIVRDFRIDNPSAEGYGQWLVKDGWLKESSKLREWYPFIMKFSRRDNLPDETYAKNPDGTIRQTALGEHVIIYTSYNGMPANISYKDEYLFRLAGTYLLRAEAYLGNNQKDLAAADVNALRSRAKASAVTAADVDIDLILDEQMRELYFEEFRVLTLCRLGKLVERGRRYNPRGVNIGDHQNLFPIPYSEIERNIFNKLEQNPGY
jgi:hypothetical protein